MTNNFLQECKKYVCSRGLLMGPVYSKVDIPSPKLMEINTFEAENYLKENRDSLFTELLFSYIDRAGQKDSDIYKKALIDRRLFSKIRSNRSYVPAKKTVLALCLALELSRPEVDELLSVAGYSLSRADDYDLVIAFCIEKKTYDFNDINEALEYFGFESF